LSSALAVSATLISFSGTPTAKPPGSYKPAPSGTIWHSIDPTAKRSICATTHLPNGTARRCQLRARRPAPRLKRQLDPGYHPLRAYTAHRH